jgi:hypothetical protein
MLLRYNQGGGIMNVVKKYFPIVSVTVLSLMVVFFVLRVLHKKPYFVAGVIAQDLKRIVVALEEIDRHCNILSLAHTKNHVDFLQVEKFKSSEIGSLNLAHPQNWRGPYLDDVPEFQGNPYQIVQVKDGIFILPADGSHLPNGIIIDKDFKISKDLVMSDMLKKDGKLNHRGVPLAAKISFEIGDVKRKLTPKTMESISKDIEEFNEAMPFTKNADCTITSKKV